MSQKPSKYFCEECQAEGVDTDAIWIIRESGQENIVCEEHFVEILQGIRSPCEIESWEI